MGQCGGNTKCSSRIAHNTEIVFSAGQGTNEQKLVQGLGTRGDTVCESINHHAFLKVETEAVTLKDDRRRNNIWLPLFNSLSQTQCRACFSGFLQSFMFQIHTFQSKYFSCHNNFINLFSDVLFNHVIFKKLDASVECLNLFYSHLAHEEPGIYFFFSDTCK